ncbi:MAG: ATP-binding protein [Comamonadaceae bacterium]|nr:ATP-binding protein [Comamonadaceae bacterium]
MRVCDRGPGVPEAYRERIFEAFFRLPGHAEREGGVGLGLALVRQIAERHGGSVRCEAREGGGSCFVLSLPAADAPGPLGAVDRAGRARDRRAAAAPRPGRRRAAARRQPARRSTAIQKPGAPRSAAGTHAASTSKASA